MGGKFTPGPWEAQESPRDDMEAMEILSETRDEIAIVELDSVDQDSLDETLSNARLIAAAPALYEACREVYQCGLTAQIRNRVLAALVLAEGDLPPVSGGAPAPEADDFPRTLTRAEQSDVLKQLVATWRREVHGS